jgi:4-hydroxy-3-methylbut-2-en-1-yl diphosphate synthase IspG/GcpE
VKHHDPVVMVKAYRLLAEQCDYPLHLGVTEAGPAFQGTVKSSVAFGALLAEGIGDSVSPDRHATSSTAAPVSRSRCSPGAISTGLV